MEQEGEFETFLSEARTRLRRAYIGALGLDGATEATAEAEAWAWEHWEELRVMDNPVGYLYRVGKSRTRPRRTPNLPSPDALELPDVEPALVPALLELPERQRVAVWLVHGCEWRHREVADALGISASAVATHVSRALVHLRDRLEVQADARR